MRVYGEIWTETQHGEGHHETALDHTDLALFTIFAQVMSHV